MHNTGSDLVGVFSFFIAKTVEETMINYVVLIVVAVWLFFAHLVWISQMALSVVARCRRGFTAGAHPPVSHRPPLL